MIPLSDGIPARRFPWVNVAIIVANFCVWIFYELPHLTRPSTTRPSTRARWTTPVIVRNRVVLSWFTAMFLHGSWDHILGNMIFLAVFGKNVEDAYGHLRYLAFYIAGGFVAFIIQTAMTLVRIGRRREGAEPRRQRGDRPPSSAPTSCSIRTRACCR